MFNKHYVLHKMLTLALERLVTNKDLAERVFPSNPILIGSVDSCPDHPRGQCAHLCRECSQGGMFHPFCHCDLALQRPVGVRLGLAGLASPSCFGAWPNLFMAIFIASLSYLLMICCYCCLTLHTGIDEWASLSRL